MNEQVAMTVRGIAFQPSRLTEYDFDSDGQRVTGSYFETDLVQITPTGTHVVTLRSDHPLVERVAAGEVLSFDVMYETRTFGSRSTVRWMVYAPIAAANGAKPTAPAQRS